MVILYQSTEAAVAGGEVVPGPADGTIETVGLALLAYGLVQLLSRVLDKVLQENTRWLADVRGRTDVSDGQPLINCRARVMVEQLTVQQRLVEQALDELRGLNRQNETMLRKLRAVWRRISRWRSGGGT